MAWLMLRSTLILAAARPDANASPEDDACFADLPAEVCKHVQWRSSQNRTNFREVFAETNFSEDDFVAALRRASELRWKVAEQRTTLEGGWTCTKSLGRIGTANFSLVQPLITREEAADILASLPREEHWDMEPDDTDDNPRHRVWNYALSDPSDLHLTDGWREPLMGAKFAESLKYTHPVLERILPQVRESYLCPDCIVRAAQIRRYPSEQRDSLPFHADEDSTVTVVVQLNADNYAGGLFIAGQDWETGDFTMQHVKLQTGDAVVHDSRLLHGIRTYGGDRYSWVIWIDPQSKLEERWQQFGAFDACDVDEDDALDADEMHCWINATSLPGDKVWSLAHAIDEDEDNLLSKFEVSNLQKMLQSPTPLVRRAFLTADTDASGTLHERELMHFLQAQGLQASGVLQEVLEYDLDGNAEIDKFELNWWLWRVDVFAEELDGDHDDQDQPED